jgi:subtilisin family serine protease
LNHSRCRSRGQRGLLRAAFIGVLLAMAGTRGWAQGAASAPSEKVNNLIRYHQEIKTRPLDRDLTTHRDFIRGLELNDARLDAEDVSIYVTERLDAETLIALDALGAELSPWGWIPPSPSVHPWGIHTGTVPYDLLLTIAADPRVVRIDSIERRARVLNDEGGIVVGSTELKVPLITGVGLPAYTGAGVSVAVADTSVDVTHGDIPVPVEAFDMTDGTGPLDWDTSVATVLGSNHGTHVSGTLVGSGALSGGKYAGAAPGADFSFYKVEADAGGIALADMVEAINRASATGCSIFSMSIGGWTQYMDGSSADCAAIDAATAAGMTSFISAGNEANDARHFSVNVAPGATTATIQLVVTGIQPASLGGTTVALNVIWLPGVAGDDNLFLNWPNLGPGEFLTVVDGDVGPAGTTASDRWTLNTNLALAGGANKTYQFTIQNTSAQGGSPLVHCYALKNASFLNVGFTNPVAASTIKAPALATTAMAVGAVVQRIQWTDAQGNDQNQTQLNPTYSHSLGDLASFSSLGPRPDGLQKPDIVAPGMATISCRDTTLPAPVGLFQLGRLIDNDGLNLDGSGPADYTVSAGTSMACPLAAGVAALLLEAEPALTPAEVRAFLTSTASQANTPDNSMGFGVIDGLAAVDRVRAVWVDFDYTGSSDGSFAKPHKTIAAAQAAITDPSAYIRIKASATTETALIDDERVIRSLGGTAIVGQ